MIRQFPAPAFGHAAEAFVVAHAAPGAWADGTAVKYRQTLTAIDGKLAASGPSAAADVAVLATPDGAAALEAAFTRLRPIASFGLVISGAAFHWIDPEVAFSQPAAAAGSPCSAPKTDPCRSRGSPGTATLHNVHYRRIGGGGQSRGHRGTVPSHGRCRISCRGTDALMPVRLVRAAVKC